MVGIGNEIVTLARAWLRSMAHPERRLTHSDSGNCGSIGELRRDAFAALKSHKIFSRIDCVAASDGERDDGLVSLRVTQGRLQMLILGLEDSVSSDSEDWVLHHLVTRLTSSSRSSSLESAVTSLSWAPVGLTPGVQSRSYPSRTLT